MIYLPVPKPLSSQKLHSDHLVCSNLSHLALYSNHGINVEIPVQILANYLVYNIASYNLHLQRVTIQRVLMLLWYQKYDPQLVAEP